MSVVWQPACELTALRARAELLALIRGFFFERGVMEVETPLLCHAGGTDPNLHPFVTRFHAPGQAGEGIPLYLQTSPEFAMKRLLAAGSGSIYQICKAFRNEEAGRLHNPEFTILEWYRVGFGLEQLMGEIEALLRRLFADRRKLEASQRIAYRDAFREYAGVDPLASLAELARCARRHGLNEAETLCGENRPLWLDLLFSHAVQPHLGQGRISFVFDYPACQPSLARPKPDDARWVERVEVFLDGMELANGFRELADPSEQERRFDADLEARRAQGLRELPKDRRLLAALESGLPDCSGVALGLDRLLMLLTGAATIDAVLAFPLERD